MRTEKSKNWGLRPNSFLCTIGVFLIAGSSLAAQPPQAQPELPPPYVPPGPLPVIPAPPPGERVGVPGQPAPSDIVVVPSGPSPVFIMPRPRFDPGDPYRVWARADLLLWWVKNAPLSMSVVTTPDITTNTSTAISPSSLDYQTIAGFRFVM